MQSFLNIRFESIEKRFEEIDLLINLSVDNITDTRKYQTFCRSAHVLLVSHFEGIYKDVVKDIIDDFNANTNYLEVPNTILNTHFNYFLQTLDNTKSTKNIKDKLKEAFGNNNSKLKVEPFLFVDNKNPTPDIINTILDRFGVPDFFWSIKDSDLDVVFENLKTETNELKNKLLIYLKENTATFPYSVENTIYNPIIKSDQKKKKTLWEDFLNEFLKERHGIVHGNVLTSPFNHQTIMDAKTKIEIITYAFIISLASIKPISTT
jgi:hypothetical protein